MKISATLLILSGSFVLTACGAQSSSSAAEGRVDADDVALTGDSPKADAKEESKDEEKTENRTEDQADTKTDTSDTGGPDYPDTDVPPQTDKDVDVDLGIECYCGTVSEEVPSASDGVTQEVLIVSASVPEGWDGSSTGVIFFDSHHMGPESSDMIFWKAEQFQGSVKLAYDSQADNLVVFACDGQGHGRCDATSDLRIVSSVSPIFAAGSDTPTAINVGVSQSLAETDGELQADMDQREDTWFDSATTDKP